MNPFRWILQHPTRPLSLWWLAAWVVIALIPLFLQAHWQLLAMQILIAMCATVGLNLIVGNAGQLVLSSAAFYALGAYCYAHAAHLLGSFAAAIILVIVVCTVAGLLIGLIATRLRGLYLAFVTLGFVLIMKELVTNLRRWTGGAVGIPVDQVPALPGMAIPGDTGLYVVIVTVVSLVVLVTAILVRTTFGAALDAIRSSDQLAASLGINRQRTVSLAFAYSCALAGVAGSMYALSIGYLSPEPFGFDVTLLHMTIIVVGGLGSILGSVSGAIVVCLLTEVLRGYPGVSEITYGIAIIFVLLIARGGIVDIGRKIARSASQIRSTSPHSSEAVAQRGSA